MEYIWEFLEKLDEMVYVSEVETNRLVYMNQHLRNALGYHSHEEYRGRPCYEVLQGASAPCSFCTNQQLSPGEFVSWIHRNPVLRKRFLIKDSMVSVDGHNYRVEIAIDADSEISNKTYYYARSETILNECLQRSLSGADPEASTMSMLAYIGQVFSCDRAYIFEVDENAQTTSNTYEWCGENVVPQKELLQNLPISFIAWWMKLFAENELAVIPNLEEIRTSYPECYAVLKSQDITSMAAGPIKSDGKILGFLGVDNPDTQMLPLVTPLLNVIGYFTSTLLKRRDLLSRLNELSFHDQLTGALNRHALVERYGTLPLDSVGVIYCDVTGLKQVNDTLGHESGDQLIRRCYELIRNAVDTKDIYRAGGDEFIAVCSNCEEADFLKNVYRLQQEIHQDEHHIAVGYAWSDVQPLSLEKLITQADGIMYQDKRNYYRESSRRPGVDRRQTTDVRKPRDTQKMTCTGTPFQAFLSSASCDVEVLFQSVSQDNDSSYFYLGDMQRNLYYISDNMRDDFGFQSNLVPDLLTVWAKRISTPEFQDLFWQDISGMLREKRTLHNLMYRVRDVRGNNQWIRCYGVLKWNEDKTQPLFFSGRVTHQNKNFVVDPVSNFPREYASAQALSELRKSGEKTLVIGFSLNGIREVNSTKGRAYGDRLLKKIADALMEKLSWKMSFFRLEGMRCMAVVNPICFSEGPKVLVDQIRAICKECYERMGIPVQNVCSFAVMEYPCGDFKKEDLIENLVSLIRLAKQEPKLSYVDHSSENVRRVKQMSNMALALSRDVVHDMEHFRIVIQPVVSAGDGSAIGGEVLLRWNFEGQDISPAVFIPILETENLINTVGRWVFEQAVATCVRLHSHDPAFYLTFNVSFHQLSDPILLPFMKETLEKYHLKGSSLVAELTESCLDEQPERLTFFVEECQKMGLYIALDDFGSGYSSLRMLLQYPSIIIKLDRSLVQEMMESEEKMSFIRSIVFACHQFGKAVCMEGVEDTAQNEIGLNTWCDMIQGYYSYRPMEVSDVCHLISQHNAGEKEAEE